MSRGYGHWLLAAVVVVLAAAPALGDFTDVPPEHKYYELITRVRELGLMVGYPEGEFRPDAPLTRYEAAALAQRIGRAVAAELAELGAIKDFARIEALEELKALAEAASEEFAAEIGLMRGRLDGFERRISELEQTVVRLESAAASKPGPKRPRQALELTARPAWLKPWESSFSDTMTWGLELGLPRGRSTWSLGWTAADTDRDSPAMDVTMNRWDLSYGRAPEQGRMGWAVGPSLFQASAAGVSDSVFGGHARLGYGLGRSLRGELSFSYGEFSAGGLQFNTGGVGLGLGLDFGL